MLGELERETPVPKWLGVAPMMRLSRWKLIVLGSLGVTVLGSIGFIAYEHYQEEMTAPSGLDWKFWVKIITAEEQLNNVMADCWARTWEYKIPDNEIEHYVPKCMRARGYDFGDEIVPEQPPVWGDKNCLKILHIMHFPFHEKCYFKPNIEDMAFDRREKFRKEWEKEKRDREKGAQKQ
jgi:hypothetical protein